MYAIHIFTMLLALATAAAATPTPQTTMSDRPPPKQNPPMPKEQGFICGTKEIEPAMKKCKRMFDDCYKKNGGTRRLGRRLLW